MLSEFNAGDSNQHSVVNVSKSWCVHLLVMGGTVSLPVCGVKLGLNWERPRWHRGNIVSNSYVK